MNEYESKMANSSTEYLWERKTELSHSCHSIKNEQFSLHVVLVPTITYYYMYVLCYDRYGFFSFRSFIRILKFAPIIK